MAALEEVDHTQLGKYSFIELIQCLFTCCNSATWCSQFVRKLPVDTEVIYEN